MKYLTAPCTWEDDNSNEVMRGWVSSSTLYLVDKIKFLSQDKLPESHDKSQDMGFRQSGGHPAKYWGAK